MAAYSPNCSLGCAMDVNFCSSEISELSKPQMTMSPGYSLWDCRYFLKEWARRSSWQMMAEQEVSAFPILGSNGSENTSGRFSLANQKIFWSIMGRPASDKPLRSPDTCWSPSVHPTCRKWLYRGGRFPAGIRRVSWIRLHLPWLWKREEA